MSRFGIQPGHDVIVRQGRATAAVARCIEVVPIHLQRALTGVISPSWEVRERLPEFLGVPIEELFTKEALASEPSNHRKPSRVVSA